MCVCVYMCACDCACVAKIFVTRYASQVRGRILMNMLKSMASFVDIENSAPRLTPIKMDNFSPLYSILFGVVQVVVPSLSVLSGEWAEDNQWQTFGRTSMRVTKVNNESVQKIDMIAKSQLLGTYSQGSWWGLFTINLYSFLLLCLVIIQVSPCTECMPCGWYTVQEWISLVLIA